MRYRLGKATRICATKCMVAACLFAMSGCPAEAAAWNSVLDEVVVILTSGWARGVAVIAIVLSGLGLMVNLFDRRMAVFIVLGVILVFGAPALVDLLISAAQGI